MLAAGSRHGEPHRLLSVRRAQHVRILLSHDAGRCPAHRGAEPHWRSLHTQTLGLCIPRSLLAVCGNTSGAGTAAAITSFTLGTGAPQAIRYGKHIPPRGVIHDPPLALLAHSQWQEGDDFPGGSRTSL